MTDVSRWPWFPGILAIGRGRVRIGKALRGGGLAFAVRRSLDRGDFTERSQERNGQSVQAGHYAIGHGAPDYNTLNSGGSDWAVKTVTETEYEPCACSPTGKIKRISLPHAPGDTPLWTTYTYDTLGRTLSVALPNGSGITTYEYNSDGTVKHTIDAKLQKAAYTYDSLKRVSSVKRYITSGGVFVEQPCQEVSFTYDSGTGANLAGRLAKATAKQCDANISEYNEVYSYEASGLLQFRDANWVRNGSTLTLRVDPTWNQMGTLDAFGYGTPGSLYSYAYTYDSAWRPATMSGEGLTLVDSIVYSAAGAMKNFTRRESASVTVTNNYAFNALNQLTNQTVARNGTTVQNLSYTFSATQNNGQILSQTDALSAETVEYTYDALNRLATAETTGPQWGLAWAYDGFGNRTNQTVTKGSGPTHSVAIDAATNRIATAGYLYDANGNMTQMPLMTMGYDVANRMVTSNHSGAGTQTYGYNQANQRIFVRNGSTVTYYFYGMGGERLMEFQETCTGGACSGYQENQRWIYFAGRKMFSMTGSTLKAIAPDRLASEAKHFPYGETDGTPPSDTKDYFATYRRDGTGLDYAWNRYYSPTIGRFTTADPYGGSASPAVPSSWNQYAYVENNPVAFADPTGGFLEVSVEPGTEWVLCAMYPFQAMSWLWHICGNSPFSEEMWSVLGPSMPSNFAPAPDPTELERRRELEKVRIDIGTPPIIVYSRRSNRGIPLQNVPRYLEVIKDCWSPTSPKAGTLAYTREITYQVQDANGNSMNGSALFRIAIFERLLEVEGNDGASSTEGRWTIANGSLSFGGQFTDYLSAGGVGALGGTPWSAFQVFYAASIGRTLIPLYHALIVKGHGITTPVLDIRYYQKNVTINGIGHSQLPGKQCR